MGRQMGGNASNGNIINDLLSRERRNTSNLNATHFDRLYKVPLQKMEIPGRIESPFVRYSRQLSPRTLPRSILFRVSSRLRRVCANLISRECALSAASSIRGRAQYRETSSRVSSLIASATGNQSYLSHDRECKPCSISHGRPADSLTKV